MYSQKVANIVVLHSAIKATFSFHKLIKKNHSNDYLIYYFVIVDHFHHDDLLY